MKSFTNLFGLALVAALAFYPGKATAAVFSIADLNSATESISHPEGSFSPSAAHSGGGVDYYWNLGTPVAQIDAVVSLDHFSGSTISFSGYVSDDASSWQMVSPAGPLLNVIDGLSGDEDDKGIRFSFGGQRYQYFGVSSADMVLSDSGSSYSNVAEFDGLATVPEPNTAILFGVSLLTFAVYRKQQKA